MPDSPPLQFIHGARNALVPARHHVDRLLESAASDSDKHRRLTAIRQGIATALECAEQVASWAEDLPAMRDAARTLRDAAGGDGWRLGTELLAMLGDKEAQEGLKDA